MYIGPHFVFSFPVDLSVQVIIKYNRTTITSSTFIGLPQFPRHFEIDFGKFVRWCFSTIPCDADYPLKRFSECGLPWYLAQSCSSLSLLVAGLSTSISWDTRCVGNIWYVCLEFDWLWVIWLPLLIPGVPHMACHLEFHVFRRQTIVACFIENTFVSIGSIGDP